jgi:hypothetical protein
MGTRGRWSNGGISIVMTEHLGILSGRGCAELRERNRMHAHVMKGVESN